MSAVCVLRVKAQNPCRIWKRGFGEQGVFVSGWLSGSGWLKAVQVVKVSMASLKLRGRRDSRPACPKELGAVWVRPLVGSEERNDSVHVRCRTLNRPSVQQQTKKATSVNVADSVAQKGLITAV